MTESQINRLEDMIAECEAALQTFVSAEETQRITQDWGIERLTCKSAWWSGRNWARLCKCRRERPARAPVSRTLAHACPLAPTLLVTHFL